MSGIRSPPFLFLERGRTGGRGREREGGGWELYRDPTLPHHFSFFPISPFNLPLPFSLSNCHSVSLYNLPPVPGEIAQSHRNPPRVKLILSLPVCLPPSVVGPIKTKTQQLARTHARSPRLHHQRQPNNKTYSRRFADNTDRI